MPINRTAYNALVDDSGSGRDGSVWDKNDVKDLLDAVDSFVEGVGLWTPVIGGSGGVSGQTYALQEGIYVKSGRLVLAQFGLVLSAKGTITGSLQINGLPFTPDGTLSVGALRWQALNTNWVNIVPVTVAGNATIFIQGCQAAALTNATALTTTDLTNTSGFVGALAFRTAS